MVYDLTEEQIVKIPFLELTSPSLFLVIGRHFEFESTSLLYNNNFRVLLLQRLYFDNKDAYHISIRSNPYSMLKKQY